MDKFAGLGLKNMLIISLFTILLIVMLKTILVKHPVEGLSQFVAAV